jgi:hypothetical protein
MGFSVIIILQIYKISLIKPFSFFKYFSEREDFSKNSEELHIFL